MKSDVFWDVTQYCLVEESSLFLARCLLNITSTLKMETLCSP